MEEWKSAGKIALVVPSVPRWEKPALCIPVFPLKKEKCPGAAFTASSRVGWVQKRLHVGPEEPVLKQH